MALREEFERSGNRLFRWRSFLPLLMILIIIPGFIVNSYLYGGYRQNHFWVLFCLLVSFFGFAIRIYTIGHIYRGTSGRNTQEQVAEKLNSTGIYSVVRHPLYLGNFFIWLGISLYVREWWVTLLFILIFWLYYERIMFAEEQFLRVKFGEDFDKWAEKTPAFIPNFRKWKPAICPFSVKRVLKREYSGFFAIIVSFVILEILGKLIIERKFGIDPIWIIILIFGLVIYVFFRILKKFTNVLNIDNK